MKITTFYESIFSFTRKKMNKMLHKKEMSRKYWNVKKTRYLLKNQLTSCE
jgi:hypothetical protein